LVVLVSGDKIKVDTTELGKLAGLSLKEIKQTVEDPANPADPAKDKAKLPEANAILRDISNRVQPQVANAFSNDRFGPDLKLNMGFKRRFESALELEGVYGADRLADEFYTRVDNLLGDLLALGSAEFSGPESFMALFNRVLDVEFERIASRAA
jgi:hypothetical protein